MEDDLDIACRLVDGVIAPQIAFDQFNPVDERAKVFPLACREVVEYADVMALVQQVANQVVADKAGAAGYEAVQLFSC